MTSTLFEGGVVRAGRDFAIAAWALVEEGRVEAVGEGQAPAADRRVDLEDATLVPAFCDAHVHLPATGLYAQGLDLRGVRSRSTILDALGERARLQDEMLFGGNFEDPLDAPLDASALDEAVGERVALLGRADMHSCIVSSALLRELDLEGLEGVDVDERDRPTGYLREKAAAVAWRWFEGHLPSAQQRSAINEAVRAAYSKGVSAVHEMYIVEWRGWDSLELMRGALEGVALEVTPYVATTELGRLQGMGMTRAGGDLFLDGAFGSHTAWLSEPYSSSPPEGSPPSGISYRSDEEVEEVFREAQKRGLQLGVHAIGDAAIEQALKTWEAIAEDVGVEAVRSLGHRIEHFECSSNEHMARAAHLGLRISIQPAFDRLWGGSDGMYASRIGVARALQMNRFGSMVEAGLTVGAGSDSTVTPLDPFLQMAALRAHNIAGESLDARAALRAHTLGGHMLAGQERSRGTIEPGRRADMALLDRDPLVTDPEKLVDTEVLGTWIGGVRVWPDDEAEAA